WSASASALTDPLQKFIDSAHHAVRVIEEAGRDQGVVEDLLGDIFREFLIAVTQLIQLANQRVPWIQLQIYRLNAFSLALTGAFSLAHQLHEPTHTGRHHLVCIERDDRALN